MELHWDLNVDWVWFDFGGIVVGIVIGMVIGIVIGILILSVVMSVRANLVGMGIVL